MLKLGMKPLRGTHSTKEIKIQLNFTKGKLFSGHTMKTLLHWNKQIRIQWDNINGMKPVTSIWEKVSKMHAVLLPCSTQEEKRTQA